MGERCHTESSSEPADTPLPALLTPPVNFGIKYLTDQVHGNVTLNLRGGESMRVNSLVLAINSPVLGNLMTHLYQTSHDMADFASEVVKMFIESLYTGEAKMPQVFQEFKDFDKMVRVFGVTWLKPWCANGFKNILNNENPTTDIFEYVYSVYDKFDGTDLLAVFLSKLKTSKHRRMSFIRAYVNQQLEIAPPKMDLLIKIAGVDVDELVRDLSERIQNAGFVLDQTSRYVLEKVNFAACFQRNKFQHDELFEMLNEQCSLGAADLRVILRIHRKSINGEYPDFSIGFCKAVLHHMNEKQYLNPGTFRTPWNECMNLGDYLAMQNGIKNLFMYFDTLVEWLREKDQEVEVHFIDVGDIIKASKWRGWDKIPRLYVNNWLKYAKQILPRRTHNILQDFATTVLECDELSSDEGCFIKENKSYKKEEFQIHPPQYGEKKTFYFDYQHIDCTVDDTVEGKCRLTICIKHMISTLMFHNHHYQHGFHFHSNEISANDLHLVIRCVEKLNRDSYFDIPVNLNILQNMTSSISTTVFEQNSDKYVYSLGLYSVTSISEE